MPEGYALGWSYIPHFIHVRFYTYAYSFAQLVALLLYRRYREDRESFAPKYLELLAAGGSASPADLVAPFGLDLRSTDTWREAFAELDALRDEAETLSTRSRAVASLRRAARPAAAAALPRLRRGGHAALHGLPRRPAAADAAALRALRRADRLAGRALPRVRRPAARASRPRAPPSPYEDGVRRLVAAWKERGLRRLADDAAATRRRAAAAARARRSTFVPPDGGRRLAARPPPGRAARAGARARAGSCRASRCSPRSAALAPPAGALACRAAPQRRRRFRRRGRRRPRSSSSTTSTRPAPPRTPPPRRSARRRSRAASTSSPSPARFAARRLGLGRG